MQWHNKKKKSKARKKIKKTRLPRDNDNIEGAGK